MKKAKGDNEELLEKSTSEDVKTLKKAKSKKVETTKEKNTPKKEKITKTKSIKKGNVIEVANVEEEKVSSTKITKSKESPASQSKKSKKGVVSDDKINNKKNVSEEEYFEDKVFLEEKKKKNYVIKEKINYTPIVVLGGIILLIVALIIALKSGFFEIKEKKMEQDIVTKQTVETSMTQDDADALIEEVVNGETNNGTNTEESNDSFSLDSLQKVFPLYDTDIYSEGSLYSFDSYTVSRARDELDNLLNDNKYINTATDGQKDILKMNKIVADRYLDNFDQTKKDEYDVATKRSYYADVTTKSAKVGDFYHSDFIALSLFGYAIDKGFYYEVPTSLYEKLVINKEAFDGMEINAEGSINLPVNNDGSLEKTIVKKVGNSSLTYSDKMGKTRVVSLQQKSDTEYYLIDASNGSYMTRLFLNEEKVCILKDARIGHGMNMEYVANNYLKYPKDLNFEVYVRAEEIVNQTSSNNMLNGQHINSNKQIWDDKGFLISLIFIE